MGDAAAVDGMSGFHGVGMMKEAEETLLSFCGLILNKHLVLSRRPGTPGSNHGSKKWQSINYIVILKQSCVRCVVIVVVCTLIKCWTDCSQSWNCFTELLVVADSQRK